MGLDYLILGLNVLGLCAAGTAMISGVFTLWRLRRSRQKVWKFLLVLFSLMRVAYFMGVQGTWMSLPMSEVVEPLWRVLWAIRKICGNLSLIFIHWVLGRDAERIAMGLNKLAKVKRILDRL